VKNIPNNNGKAGIHGVSYPGFLALDAAVDPHPGTKGQLTTGNRLPICFWVMIFITTAPFG
jgi:hypothetical protein